MLWICDSVYDADLGYLKCQAEIEALLVRFILRDIIPLIHPSLFPF